MLIRCTPRPSIWIPLLASLVLAGVAQGATISGADWSVQRVATTAPLIDFGGACLTPNALSTFGGAAFPATWVEWQGLPDIFDFQLDTDYSVTDFHLFNHGGSGGCCGAKDFTLRFYDNVGTQVGSFSGVAAAGTDLVSAPNDFSFPAISPVRRIEFEVTTGLSSLGTAINQVTWEGVAQPANYVEYRSLFNLQGLGFIASPVWHGWHKSGFGSTVSFPPRYPFARLPHWSPLALLCPNRLRRTPI